MKKDDVTCPECHAGFRRAGTWSQDDRGRWSLRSQP